MIDLEGMMIGDKVRFSYKVHNIQNILWGIIDSIDEDKVHVRVGNEMVTTYKSNIVDRICRPEELPEPEPEKPIINSGESTLVGASVERINKSKKFRR